MVMNSMGTKESKITLSKETLENRPSQKKKPLIFQALMMLKGFSSRQFLVCSGHFLLVGG